MSVIAIKRAYLSSARKVTNETGDTINRDGNTGGSEMVRRLYYGFAFCATSKRDTMQRAATAYQSNCTKDTLDTYETAANQYAAAVANDTDDCIQAAALALAEDIMANGGKQGTEDSFLSAVRAVHRYIYQQDSNTATRIRRKYDSNGNLLAINDYQYIKYPHLYIDAYTGEDSEGAPTFDIVDVNDELSKHMQQLYSNELINAILEILSPTQKRVLHYLAMGYTYETIGKRLNITYDGVRYHIKQIRQKAIKIKR